MNETKIERVRRRMDHIAAVRADAKQYKDTAVAASCGLHMELGAYEVPTAIRIWIARQLGDRANQLNAEADELEKSLEASIDLTAESV